MSTGPATVPLQPAAEPGAAAEPNVHEPLALLLRDLHTSARGLPRREAARRLQTYGPNQLPQHAGTSWLRQLMRQLTHPLALLLWLAAALAAGSGAATLGAAILVVIVLNAALAFVQEQQAERAVQALGQYLPAEASVLRDGHRIRIPAVELVPGEVLLIDEGERISADARLLDGDIEVDMSALTGESAPVVRGAGERDDARRRIDSPVLVFSGTVCTAGSASAVVHATGAHTELGRIASLSQRVHVEASPLERQVRRVAWLIAAVAVGAGIAFLPLGLLAGLSLSGSFLFAIGLLVANVPEGLLPTITLALAAGVRSLARKGAVVKRLSAVETLGSTTVICTDKTGTLTANSMRVVAAVNGSGDDLTGAALTDIAETAARCSTADLDSAEAGDPTELALLQFARDQGVALSAAARDSSRRALFRFDPRLKRMSTVDAVGGGLLVHTKGAPEEVLPRCVLTDSAAALAHRTADALAGRGLRVLALAAREVTSTSMPGRAEAEQQLHLRGLVGLLDPPRPEVRDAVRDCHTAGLRVHVVTGDNGHTAAEIAREVGIAADHVVDGVELDRMSEPELELLLDDKSEIVFSRAAAETKLRIADALRHKGHVVAMTGDGVNDAPALRRADIGVAMGRGGTDVAREAATLVLTDDNFATIATGVREGRRVYDNVRKFILYIFAHTMPEVVPFLVFALSGGAIPLPLTVLQILAIDLGTETLPALALGREAAEPGLMHRPPRPRHEGVITGRLLWRAWGLLGGLSAVLVLGGFLAVLWQAGWRPGDPTGPGSPHHHAYLQATTITFAGIVACQLGTAFAARTEWASLRSIGLTSNRLLLAGCAFEIAFSAALIYLPPLADVFGLAGPPGWALLMILPFPILVWGLDELARLGRRRRLGTVQ